MKTYDDILSHPYANYVVDVVKRYVDWNFRQSVTGSRHTALMCSPAWRTGRVVDGVRTNCPRHSARRRVCPARFRSAIGRKNRSWNLCANATIKTSAFISTAAQSRTGCGKHRQVHEAYLSRGWRERDDLLYFEDKGGEHNERCWRDRAWRGLTFLFGNGRDRD